MRKRSNKCNKKRIAAVLLSAAVIFTSFICIEKRIKKYSKEMGTYYCRAQLSELVNSSVYDVLERTGADYSKLSVDVYDDSGRFISSEICAKNINMLQGMIIAEINKNIKELSANEIKISTGTLSSIGLLNGMGPKVKIRLIPIGSAQAQLNSVFEAAGINQICHKISLDISAEVKTVCPSGSEIVEADMTCLIAENIISGEIPDSMIISK